MLLQVLEVIETSYLFHDNGKLILSIFIKEVLLSTGEDIVQTFKCDSEHPDIINLEHSPESLHHPFLYKYVELHWICRCSTVAESPYRFILDLYVIVLEDLNQLVNNTNFNTDLHLFFGSSSDVRQNPARLFSHSFLRVSDNLV